MTEMLELADKDLKGAVRKKGLNKQQTCWKQMKKKKKEKVSAKK